MADFTIRTYGDPVLRTPGETVREFGPALRSLGDAMLAAMRKAKGIGLAAPQVGLGLQLFVADVHDEDYLPILDGKVVAADQIMPMLFANAVITVPAGEAEIYTEGCLSFLASPATCPGSNKPSCASATWKVRRTPSSAPACSHAACSTSTTIAKACSSSIA